jgi:hypothetical protein
MWDGTWDARISPLSWWDTTSYSNWSRPTLHNDGANFLYMEGHVKWQRPTSVGYDLGNFLQTSHDTAYPYWIPW